VGSLMWGALSDGRTGLSFTTAAIPRQRSHSLTSYTSRLSSVCMHPLSLLSGVP
jgi:hypothetical protein